MNLGTQYYRAPFPDPKYWGDDFARIKDAGLNTVQLWVLWGWVEAQPGRFTFDDYDRLVDLAGKHGLGVILSTIAEIHPYWIHHEVPGSELVDHMGRKVVSSNRVECQFGLTPGGCFDHPGVWERMQRFLAEVAGRYRTAPNLRGWDAWNELRWNVQADGLVCFCEHTLAAFRTWLEERYGGIEALNAAWRRRYSRFEEVLPGKLPGRPYTEMMAFQHFLTCRANRHAKRRYDVIKGIDPDHLVTVHGGAPCALMPGWTNDHAVNRGNDWFFADELDGVGCSSFPKWQGIDDADFGLRVEFVKSAARDKQVWLSEVQGGRAAAGFEIFEPVDALAQQRWIWNGIACGADTILFWCWRDEVFGSESAGFGIAGADGHAEERLAAMRTTGRLLEEHKEALADYTPVVPEVGVLFSPQAYYLTWAQEGTAKRAMDALTGYARGLVRNSIPYTVVEEEHLDALTGLKVLFVPRAIVMDGPTEAVLERFVADGGTLVCESECGAFDAAGLYRYPEDRFLARLCQAREVGRRPLETDTIAAALDGDTCHLGVTQWLTPYQLTQGEVLSAHEDGALLACVPAGKGRVVLCGSYLGDPYRQRNAAGFERFLSWAVRIAGCAPAVEVVSARPEPEAFVYLKYGQSHGKKLVFVFFPKGCHEVHLRFCEGFFETPKITDAISGNEVAVSNTPQGQECRLAASPWRFSVLIEQ